MQESISFLLVSLLIMLAHSRAFIRTVSTRSYATTRALNMGLHDHSLDTLAGQPKKLSDYKGKVVLLENVATL